LIDSGVFSDSSYKLKLAHGFAKSLFTIYHSVSIKRTVQNENYTFCGINLWFIYPRKD